MTSASPKTIGDLNKVPEFLLKRRKLSTVQRQKQAQKTKLQIAKNVRYRKQPTPSNFKRLEYFVERANRREWERLRILKEARKAEHLQESNLENMPRPIQSKTRQIVLAGNEDDQKIDSKNCPCIVIIRTSRQHKLTKATKKILKDFRLTKVFMASLFRLDQDILYKLTVLKENVVWGYVSAESVKNLVLKRGRSGTLKTPEPLNNNMKIEQALGHKNVICLEDLMYELTATVEKTTSADSKFEGSEPKPSTNPGISEKLPETEALKTETLKTIQSDIKFQMCRNYMLPFQLSMPEGGKRAVSNFVDKELNPGFRKEADLKLLLSKMV